MDDLLTRANTIEIRKIRNKIIALLSRGGFTIKQWVFNDEQIIKDLATSVLHTKLVFEIDRLLKTLSIS